MFTQLTDWFPVLLSLRVAFISVFIISFLGLPLARLMARREFYGKEFVEAAITLPLVLPPSVVGYALLVVIGKNGLLGKTLAGMGITLVFTWYAVVLAATVVAFPLMYQSAKAAFQSVDVNLEKAARTLGAGEVRIFFTVTSPGLARYCRRPGAVLCPRPGEFGATLMVAGNIPGQTQTIPTAIYFAVESGRNEAARTLVAIITVFSFLVIFWVNRWAKNKSIEA